MRSAALIRSGAGWSSLTIPSRCACSPSDGVTASPLAPEEALGAFIGENPNGTWTLTVSDDGISGVGTLQSWGLQIESLPAMPPPASASSYTQSPGAVIASGAPN